MFLHRCLLLSFLVACGSSATNDLFGDPQSPAGSSPLAGGPDGSADEDSDPGGEASACDLAPAAAEQVLFARCGACHGDGSPGYGSFDDAADPAGLVRDGWVIPGYPAGSPIFVQIDQGEMPPTGPLGADDVTAVRQWIECGALSWITGEAPPPGSDPGTPGGDDGGGDDDDDDDGGDDDDGDDDDDDDDD